MNKAIFTVMLLLAFSFTGCIDDGQNDLQPESNVEPTIEPTGAADFDSLTYNNGKLYFSAYSSAYGGEYWYITV